MTLGVDELEEQILNVVQKQDWKPVKFSDFVENIVEKVQPKTSGIDKYIGLKHLDSGSIHIDRYGSTSTIEGDKLKAYKGDLIFAKRNAYLKRVARLNSDAVASAHSLVLRAKTKLINEDLLPFFMLSETFWEKAIEISVGSLSPTINWRKLAAQDFYLPPLNTQKEISEVLVALDELIFNESILLKKAIVNKHAFRKKVFSGFDKNLLKSCSKLTYSKGWKIQSVSEACLIENNLRKPINKEDRQAMEGEYPYYGPTSILSYISEFRVDGEYALLGEDGDHFLKYSDWYMSQWAIGKFNVNNHAHLIKGGSQCLTKWIYYSFQHRNIIPHLTKQGATRYKLNKESLLDIKIMLPPLNEQQRLIDTFDKIEDTISTISSKIEATKKLRMSIINRIF